MSISAWLKEHDEPKAHATHSTPEEVLGLLRDHAKTTLVLDLRNDREKKFLKNSVHIPATTLTGYRNLKQEIVEPLLSENIALETIVVHCNSSKTRAPKVAGWLEDYIEENDSGLKVTVLDGGITQWLELGDPYTKYLEEHED
jgi:arsenical-resistance protein 2